MFVKLSMQKPVSEDIWVNTEQIVTLEPKGKAFNVHLSNGAILGLDLVQYLVLIKAMEIKKSVKLNRKIPPAKVTKQAERSSTPVPDKPIANKPVKPKAEAKTLTKEKDVGTAVKKPETRLIKKVASEKLSFGDAVILTKKGTVKKAKKK